MRVWTMPKGDDGSTVKCRIVFIQNEQEKKLVQVPNGSLAAQRCCTACPYEGWTYDCNGKYQVRQCVVLLARSNLVVELQFAALTSVGCFPFAGSSGTLSMEDMSDALLSILVSEHKIVATPTLNANLVRGTAVVGINVV
jgi:late competence protein required for DNA uptake (superfamily II DNA/RNA helicase)